MVFEAQEIKDLATFLGLVLNDSRTEFRRPNVQVHSEM